MIDAVLLLAFGGPERPADVRPFLARVARGRRIPPGRLEEVAGHYARMPGGRSPLNDLTRRQARALEAMLAGINLRLPVVVGLRHWTPSVADALAALADRGCRQAVGVILSAFRTEASWDRYIAEVAAARARRPGAPAVEFAPPFFDHPLFVRAVADRVRAALARVPAGERPAVPLVFTAHSVPLAMAGDSPYTSDFRTAAAAVAAALDHPRWSLAYQSRSGAPGECWLEPDVGEVLARLAAGGARQVVVVPIGFVCDHVEVLYDLDVEARAAAGRLGLGFHRATAVNDHPAFLAALADLIQQRVEASR